MTTPTSTPAATSTPMRVAAGLLLAGTLALAGPASADSPGQVSTYEFRHTPTGERRVDTEARYETTGWHVVTTFDGQGRRHFLRRYPTTSGRLTRAQVEYVGQPGRGRVTGTAWCTRADVEAVWVCS